MNYHKPLMILATTLFIGQIGLVSTASGAANEEAAIQAEQAQVKAEEARLQAQLEAEHKKALVKVEKQRQTAEASIVKARKQLRLVAEEREKASAADKRAQSARQAEMSRMHEELKHARLQLRETSREMARVNREVERARARDSSARYVVRTSDRPVIGVILGDANDVGIKVVGVSPDGPSERAGIQQGDVIVAMGGSVLAAVDDEGDARDGLGIAMKEIRAGEPVIVSVERDDQTLDLTVIPEIREPLTWQFDTRFSSTVVSPSSPASPAKVISIERIEVPQLDTEGLTEQIEQIRIEIEERGALMESGEFAPHVDDYEFEFHELSEMGDFALHDANVWFGLPMTQGLKLAEIDPDLGAYFKTDRGVLVLKARTDNELQLESGDVILQVGDTAVNSPAEFMRALRDFDSGDSFEMDIKRNRKDRTLKTVMPESRSSFFDSDMGNSHSYRYITHDDHD